MLVPEICRETYPRRTDNHAARHRFVEYHALRLVSRRVQQEMRTRVVLVKRLVGHGLDDFHDARQPMLFDERRRPAFTVPVTDDHEPAITLVADAPESLEQCFDVFHGMAVGHMQKDIGRRQCLTRKRETLEVNAKRQNLGRRRRDADVRKPFRLETRQHSQHIGAPAYARVDTVFFPAAQVAEIAVRKPCHLFRVQADEAGYAQQLGQSRTDVAGRQRSNRVK